MQLSSPKNSHYTLLIFFTLILMGDLQTHASKINSKEDIQKDIISINGPNTTQKQDLYFEDVSLKKNDLNINSDAASIKDLSSQTTIFTFLGNVEIISEIVIIKCDKALLEFKNNELQNAKFIGKLSSFQQFNEANELIAYGTAEIFEYEHATNILRMEENALVNNGSNEVSGNLITYNLVKRNIIADSENGSPVKLIIDSTNIN